MSQSFLITTDASCYAVPLPNALVTIIADALIKKFICIFGAPKVILTNQGRNFLSSLTQKVAKRFKIKRVKTAAFHPQSNGSLERSHHALGEFLKQYSEKDCEWDQWIEIALFNYNTCIHEGTKNKHLSKWSLGVWLDHGQVNHSKRIICNQPTKETLKT